MVIEGPGGKLTIWLVCTEDPIWRLIFVVSPVSGALQDHLFLSQCQTSVVPRGSRVVYGRYS